MSNLDFDLAESLTTTNASYFIFVYILVLIYCCFGLAVVCDVYFVPALQKLSYTYDLPPDIAGSTLMALGASVPELFASLIGVFVTEDDIGTGSIIGSSCFNLIAVPAVCAFVASATFSRKLTVSPIPVIRNSAFYAITVLVLLLIIKDNKVDIPEAMILLLFFAMYMAFMIVCAQTTSPIDGNLQNSLNNSYISNDSAIGECGRQKWRYNKLLGDDEVCGNGKNLAGNKDKIYGQFHFDQVVLVEQQSGTNGAQPAPGTNEKTPLCSAMNNNKRVYNEPKREIIYPSEQILDDSCSIELGFAVKNSACLMRRMSNMSNNPEQFEHDKDSWLSSNWILLPMLPITLSLKLLSPLKFKNTCWTIWTFIVSIALIGALTYVSVWMVHLFGQAVGMPETVAGMTILSWGTGIPELIASVVLIKKTAQADMAICNTIGSNVIDASFCLSLPWIIKCIMNKAAGLKPEVEVQSEALPWTSFTLFLSVIILLLVLKFHNWELSCSVGVWLMITYGAFVACATYLESTYSSGGLDLLAMV